ncbi:hypothetical protein [Brevibacillus fulvus]|uniref:YrzI family protein n=1 Tax=Brevibacillus fulvus TaxID=1125967 RepID=A0A938XTI4_9BACL|nr:hypothetical protein [Brevibacillus fulvus]MBM7589807.1 hypothetical protein [Brevibacillus fulvus]
MIVNLLFFTVKIEKNKPTAEQRWIQHQQESLLKQRELDEQLKAAEYPEFVTRF